MLWCREWDLNPHKPTSLSPKPDSFDSYIDTVDTLIDDEAYEVIKRLGDLGE
ncbi:MAG: hypothetical protein RQ885_08210 [Desulfurococcales archaeon]|nr:hypothetical protein [Desulfurococcales archaeon]